MDFNPEYALELLNEDISNLNSTDPLTSFKTSALQASFLKKWEVDDRKLDNQAIDLFESYNFGCLSNRKITLDVFEALKEDTKHILFRAFRHQEFQMPELTLARCLDFGRCGPGSSVGTKHTDFYQKFFTSRLTCTSYDLHAFMIANVSPRWRLALLESEHRHGLALVKGSNLSTVPKNRNTKRTICTEPTINMFYQLGAGRIIEGLLKRSFHIDLSTQPDINRGLARLGSIDGRFATIDLSSASDSISSKLVKDLLPRSEYNTLDLIRSKFYKHDQVYKPFHLFSSMGNGFTFPLQTLIFAACVKAVYRYHFGTCSSKVNVFGDDIICHKEVYDTLTSFLNYIGFSVNLTKSYNDGLFRESCGSDFYKGHNVRGVYLKHVKGASDVYSIFNRLARWSAVNGILLPRVLLYLKGLVKLLPVPLDESDAAGFKIPLSLRTNIRFKHKLFKYNKLMPDPKCKRVDFAPDNPHGCLIAALGGYVRNGRVVVRQKLTRFKVISCVTPRWDYTGDARYTAGDLEYALSGVL
nr:MAG: hypothetical protein 3 [Leviviridae sp.]